MPEWIIDRTTGYIVSQDRFKLLQHRVIWEEYNGKIPSGMIIHHIDEDKINNNIDNLLCLTRSEHTSYHSNKMSDETKNKISLARIGRKLSKETKQKMSDFQKSRVRVSRFVDGDIWQRKEGRWMIKENGKERRLLKSEQHLLKEAHHPV